MLELTIPASVPSYDWHRLAMKWSKEDAAEVGADWLQCQILVHLPEGRHFWKPSGAQGFGSYR